MCPESSWEDFQGTGVPAQTVVTSSRAVDLSTLHLLYTNMLLSFFQFSINLKKRMDDLELEKKGSLSIHSENGTA